MEEGTTIAYYFSYCVALTIPTHLIIKALTLNVEVEGQHHHQQ
jgi:hypothetical protein